MNGLATLSALAAVGVLVGFLIGCVGIGGVLLVPTLTYLGGFGIHEAIAACMMSYLFSGGVAALVFARRGSVEWSPAGWLCVGAMPGAFLGAALVSVAPGRVLELLLALMVTFAGLHALRDPEPAGPPAQRLAPARLALIGALTGFGSALTGTGGPLILVPTLVWLRQPVLRVVGLSQVIQVPIALLATVGNLLYTGVNATLGTALAALLTVGAVAGARLAHALPRPLLKRAVAAVLVATGATIGARLLAGGFAPAFG